MICLLIYICVRSFDCQFIYMISKEIAVILQRQITDDMGRQMHEELSRYTPYYFDSEANYGRVWN